MVRETEPTGEVRVRTGHGQKVGRRLTPQSLHVELTRGFSRDFMVGEYLLSYASTKDYHTCQPPSRRTFIMPTAISEPTLFPSLTPEALLAFQFSSWYRRFSSLTIKSTVIKPLGQEFHDYLCSDGVFLPEGSEDLSVARLWIFLRTSW